MALRPEPPMSMARVMGAVAVMDLRVAGLGALDFAALGVIRGIVLLEGRERGEATNRE
jgi:hypothetical protein